MLPPPPHSEGSSTIAFIGVYGYGFIKAGAPPLKEGCLRALEGQSYVARLREVSRRRGDLTVLPLP